eukprot:s365_g8.t1
MKQCKFLVIAVAVSVTAKKLHRQDFLHNEAIGPGSLAGPLPNADDFGIGSTGLLLTLNATRVGSATFLAKAPCSTCCKKDPDSPEAMPFSPGQVISTYYREEGLLSRRSSKLASATVEKLLGKSIQVQLLSSKDATFVPKQAVRAHLPIGEAKSPDPLEAVVVNSTEAQTTVRFKSKYVGEVTVPSSWVQPSWATSFQFLPIEWVKTDPKVTEVDCSPEDFEECISKPGCMWKEPEYKDLACVVADWGEWQPCSVTCGVGKQKRFRPFPTQRSCRKLNPQPLVAEDRYCMKPACPLVAGHCEAAKPNSTGSAMLWQSKARTSLRSTKEPRKALRSPPATARGALLELLGLTHAGEDPLQAVQGELQNIIDKQASADEEVKKMTKPAKTTGPSPLHEHPLYSEEETIIAWAEKGTGLGPECPESYFAFQVDIDVETSTISAACNPCAAGCLHCSGPSADQCRACPSPLRLFTHIDGRSVCVEGCPECFKPNDDDGTCTFDGSQYGCDHVAAFHPEVMPEHRGEPDSCQALKSDEDEEEDDSFDSVDLFLLRKRKRALLAKSPAHPTMEALAGEQGDIEQKKQLKKQIMEWVETKQLPDTLDQISQYGDAAFESLGRELLKHPELAQPLALALGHEDSEAEPPRGHDEPVSSHDDASTSPEPLAEAVDYESSEEPSPSEDSAASLRIWDRSFQASLVQQRDQSRFALWNHTQLQVPLFSEVLNVVMKSMGKVTAELLQQGRRESSEKHAVLLQDAESEASEMQRRARVMASKLETECHRMLHYELLAFTLTQREKERLLELSAGMVQSLYRQGHLAHLAQIASEASGAARQVLRIHADHANNSKRLRSHGAVSLLVSSARHSLRSHLQAAIDDGAVALSMSAEEKADVAERLQHEAQRKLVLVSRRSVAKIVQRMSEDLDAEKDELIEQFMTAPRAILATELGKLTSSTLSFAAVKVEEKLKVTSMGTPLAKKEAQSAIREVQKHLDSSAVHAIEAVAAAADEAAATIKAKMKKSAGTALMQLRTGDWQSAMAGILAEAKTSLAEKVISTRMSTSLKDFIARVLDRFQSVTLSPVSADTAPAVAAVETAARATVRKALEATHSYLGSGRPGSLMSALSHSVHMLIRKKCHAAGNLSNINAEFQSFDLAPQDDLVLQSLHDELQRRVAGASLTGEQKAKDAYLDAQSSADPCPSLCARSANDLAEFLSDLGTHALSQMEGFACRSGRKGDTLMFSISEAAAASTQRHCAGRDSIRTIVEAVKSDMGKEAAQAKRDWQSHLEALVTANETGITSRDQQKALSWFDKEFLAPLEESLASFLGQQHMPCSASDDGISSKNRASILYRGAVRRLLREASIKLASKVSEDAQDLNNMLLQAFYPMSGPDGTEVAQDVDSESYPNGIILLEEGDKVTRSGYGLELAETEAILDRGFAELQLFSADFLRKGLKGPTKMMTDSSFYKNRHGEDKVFLDMAMIRAQENAANQAIALLYGDGKLGNPLCPGAETLASDLDLAYEQATTLRDGNLFGTFLDAGKLLGKLFRGSKETHQFITNLYDTAWFFKHLLSLISNLPIVGWVAKILVEPVKILEKFIKTKLLGIRDKLKDKWTDIFKNAFFFNLKVARYVRYAIEAIPVLKMQAYPANKAAELVGLAMGVCVWLPDLTTIANNAMKGLVAADQMAGIATDFVRDIMNWVEGLVPESVITKMAQVNNFFDVIMTPTRGFKVALFDSHKVCIIFKCFEFSLRDLLAALTGFLEKIFNFVLSPFRPIVDAVAAPIKKLFDPIIKMLPTPAIFFDKVKEIHKDDKSLSSFVGEAFSENSDTTFLGQIEKAYELTKEQAGFCFSYGTELSEARAICKDITESYGEVSNPFECQKLCQSACGRCVRWSFVITNEERKRGRCRFTRNDGFYEIKSPSSVSGPKSCGDITKYQPDTWQEHSQPKLCKDMGAFPEMKDPETCKKACFVDADCKVAQMSGGICWTGIGKDTCSRGPTSMSLHKTRTAKEALQTRCNAAGGVQRAKESKMALCPRDVEDCDVWALEEATKHVHGSGSEVFQEAMALTGTSWNQFTCELLDIDVDCPDVNKGDKVDNFDICKEQGDTLYTEEKIQELADSEVVEQLSKCRAGAAGVLEKNCKLAGKMTGKLVKKFGDLWRKMYCPKKQLSDVEKCDWLIERLGSFQGATKTTGALRAEIVASYVPSEQCAKAAGDQWLCELKFLNEGGGETKQMDLTNQIQLQNMYQAKQFDMLAAENQKVQGELAEIQSMMDEGFAKTQEQLFAMDAAAANRTGEQTKQIFEKIDASQKEQNARLAYMMQAAQCDNKLQTKELKDFVSNGLDNLQNAVLSGTGQQIDAAVSKMQDAVAKSQRAMQTQMAEGFSDVKQTVTEGFDKMQKKLDANRKAVQEQLTQRFNKVDQHLVKVQGQLDVALKNIDVVDNRIKDLAKQSSRQFEELRHGQQRQMTALLAVVQKLEVLEEKIDDIPVAVRESRFQDFIYEFEKLSLALMDLFKQVEDFSAKRRVDLEHMKTTQLSYQSCGSQIEDVIQATKAVKESSAQAVALLQKSFKEAVMRFAEITILAVDSGFSKMHFDALAEQIAEDLRANESEKDLFLSHESLKSVIVADQEVLHGADVTDKCAAACKPHDVTNLRPCQCSDGRHPLRQVSGKYLFTPVAAEMLLDWAKAALDDVPLKFSISLKDLYMQISYMHRKFASWGLESPDEHKQFNADWERMAFDFENIRKSYAMVDSTERAVVGKLQLSSRLLDAMATTWSPAPLECQKPALMDLGESELSRLVLWSPLKPKEGTAAWLILRQPSRLLHTSALSWVHDAAVTDCRSIPDGYGNIEGLMQSGFICWRDINGVAKVRSMCDPRGVADVVDESALKWVSEEKFAQYGAQHALLTPIATSKIRTTPFKAEVLSYWERQVSFIVAASCGNGKLDMTEECDSPGEGCKKCKLVPGYECPVPGEPCQAVCGDHKAVKMEDCDEADSDKNDGCTPSCQLEFCPRKALSLPITHAARELPDPSPDLELCGSQARGSPGSLEKCSEFTELVFAGFSLDGHWVRHDVRLDETIGSAGAGPWDTKATGWKTLGAPYKIWNDGESLAVTCKGADTMTGCLFWCMALSNSSECLRPWLVQTNANPDQDVHAEKLLIYGRKSSDSTDLQTCTDGEAQLVTMQCGDKLITGNEECDPPGGCCDPKCKLIPGFQWQDTDGCKAICGDGVVLGKEECDPPGDGCNEECRLKEGWKWLQNKAVPICGDSLLVGKEQCDPPGSDCCNPICDLLDGWKWEDGCKAICGDGVVLGKEECDPPGEGCTEECRLKEGWEWVPLEKKAASICGDGLVVGKEQCDQGECCADNCTLLKGWQWESESGCKPICGDEEVVGDEECDPPGMDCTADCKKRVDLLAGLECDYFYDKTQCVLPDLRTLTPVHREIVPEIYMSGGKFPKIRQLDQFCVRCTGLLVTKKEGNYKFFLASDDGSLMWLNGEQVVDNNDCHGEREKGSSDKFLKPGAHEIRVEMCENYGGQVFKMRYQGPDTGNSKVKVPAAVLKHEKKLVPWFMGNSGETCDSVCERNSYERCDKEQMVALSSNEKVSAAFREVGYHCKGYHGARNYPGSPFSTGRNDDCAPVTPETSPSSLSCDRNQGGGKPLCACKEKKDRVWFQADFAQPCNDVCKANGFRSCDKQKMAALDSNDKVKAAFAKVGHVCKSFHASRNYPGAPFITGRKNDDCTPVTSGTSASALSCSKVRHSNTAPLCACKDKVKVNWKLALKVGETSTLGFSSPLWTNTALLNEASPVDTVEDAKYKEFNAEPFERIRMCVGSPESNCVVHDFSKRYSSARALFSAGYIRDESVDKDGILSSFGPVKGSYRDCPMQRPGFNIECKDGNKARWGFCANCPSQACQSSDSNDADAAIGIGIAGQSTDTELGAGWTAYFASGAGTCHANSKTFKPVWLWVNSLNDGCGSITGSSGLGIGWNAITTMKEGILVNPGQRDYKLQNVPSVLIGGKYSGTKTWPSAGTWTISYDAPVTLYVWVMKHHYNAGVDAALSGDGWEQVDAGDFKRSDNHVLNVWKRSFSSGSQYQIKTTGLMVGGVVSNGCQAAVVKQGLKCGYFYDKSQCRVPDLSDWTPAHEVVVPKIFMEHGKFPEVRQGDQFCIRCTGQLVTKKEGNYKFFLSSDDGSFMWLNGEKVVDNNDCHGERERGSSDKFLLPGVHDLAVDMCEMYGGEVLKMRYQGPDTGNSKITIPEKALQYVVAAEDKAVLEDGLECDYYYDQSQCRVPNLGALTLGFVWI